MKYLSNLKKIILLGIIINLTASILYVKNFDQNIIVENKYKNQMIKSDIASYNLNAAKILNNLKNKEKIFYQSNESSSSGFNSLNTNSNYYKKKNLILNLFSSKKNDQFELKISTLKNFMLKNKINKIDILKIDTEGFELPILKGLGEKINKTRYIYIY